MGPSLEGLSSEALLDLIRQGLTLLGAQSLDGDVDDGARVEPQHPDAAHEPWAVLPPAGVDDREASASPCPSLARTKALMSRPTSTHQTPSASCSVRLSILADSVVEAPPVIARETIDVAFRTGYLHFFDLETGEALR